MGVILEKVFMLLVTVLFCLRLRLKCLLYSLGIDYSSYSVPRLYKIFASENVFRAQVLGTFREQLEEGSNTR